jgi:hypothetical protein
MPEHASRRPKQAAAVNNRKINVGFLMALLLPFNKI